MTEDLEVKDGSVMDILKVSTLIKLLMQLKQVKQLSLLRKVPMKSRWISCKRI